MWKELNSLMADTDLSWLKHENPDWRNLATCNIDSVKDILRHQQENSPVHLRLYEGL
ncbi:5774_t:CDS:2 [Entrophospora sp. SA101]|nr:5774_t:CDS:2 [Entrophospora sp. SA101]